MNLSEYTSIRGNQGYNPSPAGSSVPSEYSFDPADPEESQKQAYPEKRFDRPIATGRALPLRNRSPEVGTAPTAAEFSVPKAERSRVDEMSKPVLFYGKPNQLDDVLTFVSVKNLVDGTTEPEKKSAALAALFRGAALTWLSQQLKLDSDLLSDYDVFVENVQATFGLSTAAQLAQSSRKYANCYQKASVQLYALEFKQLSTSLNIPEVTATAQFVKGLKSHLREALIINDDANDSLDDVIAEAQRIDSQLFTSKRGGRFKQGQGSKPSGTGSGKCHSCGQFGHKAKDCKVKREGTPW